MRQYVQARQKISPGRLVFNGPKAFAFADGGFGLCHYGAGLARFAKSPVFGYTFSPSALGTSLEGRAKRP